MILLLIFVGQATASAVISCSMQSSDTSQSMNDMMKGMDHSLHSMDNPGDDQEIISMMQDCCADGEHCSMASCFFVTISSEIQVDKFSIDSQKVNFNYTLATSQSLSSLFRPPILS